MYVLTYEPTSKRIENGLDEVYSVQMQKKVMKENSTILIVRVLCSIVLLYHTDCYNITVKNFGKIDSTELSNCYLERKG